jgi:hypothetical protein
MEIVATVNRTDNLTVKQTMDVTNKAMTLLGTESYEETIELMNSRFQNSICRVFDTDKMKWVDKLIELNAIPLKDWCKDNNYNFMDVFNHLKSLGVLNTYNELEIDMFMDIHELQQGEEILVSSMTIFNTYSTQGGRIVLINPSSVHYKNFTKLLEGVKLGTYKGSKGYTAEKICRAMQDLCKEKVRIKL